MKIGKNKINSYRGQYNEKQQAALEVSTLNELKPGQSGVVTELLGTGALRRRIIDMGIIPGTIILMKRMAPFGDPIQINVRGYELSIRKSEAKEIVIDVLKGEK